MADNGGRSSSRQRILAIALVLMVTVVFATASTLLVREVSWQWSVGSIILWLAIGVLVMLSGIAVNSLSRVILTIWRRPYEANIGIFEMIDRIARAMHEPLKLIRIAVVAGAIVAAGIGFRPPPIDIENGTLVVMTAFGNSANDPRTMIIDQWNQQHPLNRVVLDYADGVTDQQNERMVKDAKPDGEHKADVYVLDVVWTAQFVDKGYIQKFDASSLDTSDFIPKVLDTCMRNNTLWALPFNTDAGLMFYRSDLAKPDKPTNWDDYFGSRAKDLVTEAKKIEPKIEATSVAQLANEEILTIMALEAIWAAGGEVVAKNGQVLLTPDGAEVNFDPAALTGIKKLAAAFKDPEIMLADAVTTSAGPQASKAFTEGRALYMRNWPVARDDVNQKVPFGITSLSPSVLGGQNLAISKWTSKPRAAHALIEFLTSASSELILSEIGGFAPTRRSAFDNAKRAYSAEVSTAVNGARLRPVTPNYTEFSREFRRGISRALNNGGKLETDFPRKLADALRSP